ncbi:MAG: YlmH/Sll1252 family protein [Clostridia bacterium]|nr:YlmH/Sll1252 family protein [Clostridia bacterium]
MLNKQKLLSHLINQEDKLVMAKVLDKAEEVLRNHQARSTDFLDPSQQELAQGILNGLPEFNYLLTGGFPQCERRKVILCPDYLEPGDMDHGLVFLKITGNFKFQQVSHRDYLGSLLGLGIKREKIGDLFLFDQGCYAIVDNEVASYIINNLTQVHRVGVKVSPVGQDQVELPAEEVKESRTTLSSLRLDTVACAGFGVSRSQMAREIEAEKVKLNWVVNSRKEYPVKEGDIISIRGRGRLEVAEIGGKTRKERIVVVLRRYL